MYRRSAHSVTALHAHLVFVTKYRRPVFTDDMLTRCEHEMRQACERLDVDLSEFNGERDHVHLLVEYPPKVAVSVLVQALKGVSSRRLRQGFSEQIWMRDRLWSPSYFAASAGGAPLSIIRQYVEQQQRPG